MAVNYNDLDHALFFTLSYSDNFVFPLKEEEIKDRLPKVWDWNFLTASSDSTKKAPINKNDLTKSLEKLESNQIIKKLKTNNSAYYFLKNRQHLVQLRLNKIDVAKKRQLAIKEACQWLKRFPSIKALALTGSSAVNNADFADDLDFCLIVQKNTLWITRFFVILLAKILGKQPQIDAQAKKNKIHAWCFNLWLDEGSLNITKRGSSIYQAYEIKQMRWLFDRANIQEKIVSANSKLAQMIELYLNKQQLVKFENGSNSYLLLAINYLFFLMQNIYRRIFFGEENFLLDLSQAHFNDVRRQKRIFEYIKKIMKTNDFLDF